MVNINLEIFLGNISFVLLFLIMIFYWIQAIFSIIPKFDSTIFLTTVFANLSLLTLLIIRWFNYSHFPLSNLYESLIFLSWSFTLIQLIFIPSIFKLKNKPETLKAGASVQATFSLEKNSCEAGSQLLPTKQFNSDDLPKRILNFGSIPETVANNGVTAYTRSDNSSLKKYFKISESSDKNYVTINTIIGTIISPIALFTNSFATFSLPKTMQKAQALVPALQSNWLMMHVTVMMLSYTALLCGSLLAITFLIVTWLEKNEPFFSLPNSNFKKKLKPIVDVDRKKNNVFTTSDSIDFELPINTLANTLDNLSYRILGIGFPLLTIGILSGAVWANEAWGSYWSWDPKETWAFITWLIFAIYLHIRITKGWQGRKPAILASCGFFVVWICYLGVNILGSGLHSYGWLQ